LDIEQSHWNEDLGLQHQESEEAVGAKRIEDNCKGKRRAKGRVEQ